MYVCMILPNDMYSHMHTYVFTNIYYVYHMYVYAVLHISYHTYVCIIRIGMYGILYVHIYVRCT